MGGFGERDGVPPLSTNTLLFRRVPDRDRIRHPDDRAFARLLRRGPSHRDDHVELDTRPRRTQLIDAHHRARRLPVAEILIHRPMHAVSVANVSEIFRHLHDIRQLAPT